MNWRRDPILQRQRDPSTSGVEGGVLFLSWKDPRFLSEQMLVAMPHTKIGFHTLATDMISRIQTLNLVFPASPFPPLLIFWYFNVLLKKEERNGKGKKNIRST